MRGGRLTLRTADAVLAILATAAVVIAITGGTTLYVRGAPVRLHSVGLLLLLCSMWAIARWMRPRPSPFLGLGRLPFPFDPAGAAARLGDRLARVPLGAAIRIVAIVAAVTLAVKIANIAAHPGFLSGDDVEIHEMTIGHLVGAHWPIWDLRSACYPMVFVYPIQAAVARLTTDPRWLVASARAVVALISTATAFLLFGAARARHGTAIALAAAVIFATSHLTVEFGGTELPRPVSAAFLVLAAWSLSERGSLRTVLAAVSLGIAASLRFSEVIFFVPAALDAWFDGGVRRAAAVVVVATATAAGIQYASDALFWHDAFHSLRAAVTFTLIDRQSSRGYEPWTFYVSNPTTWTSALVFALAIVATLRRHWRDAAWVWIPLALLSCLPHKEPRYAIPDGPFVAVLGALGFVETIDVIRGQIVATASVRMRQLVAAVLMVAIPATAIWEVSRFHVHRSDADVALARALAAGRSVRQIAANSLWRLGGHLYLSMIPVIAELPSPAGDAEGFERRVATRPDVVLVTKDACRQAACDVTLASLGYVESKDALAAASSYRDFELSRHP